MADQDFRRDDEIKTIWREYRFFYQILGGLLLVGIGVFIGMIAFSAPADRTGYLINLYTSILSIAVTVFVIDFLNRRRDERREMRQLQEQLVRDASSTSNEIAKNAMHQLKRRDWLRGEGGLLRGAILSGANLDAAALNGVNLAGAKMHFVSLKGAFLVGANLAGADLHNSNLQGAHLRDARLDETTILPDGSRWTPATDLAQFGCLID
jgi:hypothetical protein